MNYAGALYDDPGATLDDLREAVETLADAERTARRVFGGTHPLTVEIECDLQKARAALGAREAGFDSICDALAAMTPGSVSNT